MSNRTLKLAALKLAASGKPVFPCKNTPKNAVTHKTPLTGHGFKDATCDSEQIKRWWTQWTNALIGMPTGPVSGVDVLDLDVKNGKDGLAAVPDWEQRSSVIARTGSGGAHLYFKSDGNIRCTSDQIAHGVDTRGHGGYVIVPPSQGYSWVNGHDFNKLPPWPDDLRPREKQQQRETQDNPFANADTYPPADRAEIKAALAVIPSDKEPVWFEVGCALAFEFGDAGLPLFVEWSVTTPDKFAAAQCLKKWEHCKTIKVYTAGTIFHHATEANPEWRAGYKTKQSSEPAKQAARVVRPVDLWAQFNAPTLPLGLLPPVIEGFAVAQASMMGCDAGGLAMAALAVCAAAIPDGVVLQVKRHDPSWLEPARIWVALVGDPSTKKSPIIRAAARPLIQLDGELYRDYLTALETYEAKTDDEKKLTRPPKRRRLRLEDTTIEASQTVLMDNPDGMLCLQDELSGWIGSMDKYSGSRGSAKDRGYWLQSFNGGQYVVDRIGRKSGVIENLSMCLLGGIQPEPLRKIADDAVDDGLLQRLFPIVLPPATMGRDEPQLSEVEDYHALVGKLRVYVDDPFLDYGRKKSSSDALRFAEPAQKLRDKLEAKHLELQKYEAINKKLSAHVGKLDGLFARLCVLWHVVEHKNSLPPVVTLDTARRVAKFMHDYLLPHAVAFYAGVLGLSDEHDRLTSVAGYILAHKRDRITTRDVQRGDRTMRNLEKRDTDGVFEQLAALGWVSQVSGPRRDSPPQWVVNPEVHTRFEARAKAEAERRAAVRKAVGMLLGDNDDD